MHACRSGTGSQAPDPDVAFIKVYMTRIKLKDELPFKGDGAAHTCHSYCLLSVAGLRSLHAVCGTVWGIVQCCARERLWHVFDLPRGSTGQGKYIVVAWSAYNNSFVTIMHSHVAYTDGLVCSAL